MIKKIATVLQLAVAFQIVFGVFMPRGAAESVLGSSENIPSPSVKTFYRIDSEHMHLSDFPNTLVLYDLLMIDIDVDALNREEEIEADLYLPLIPDNLNDIVLFDGWHVAHFRFERINEYCVHIKTRAENLVGFDGTVGLFLFVTGVKD